MAVRTLGVATAYHPPDFRSVAMVSLPCPGAEVDCCAGPASICSRGSFHLCHLPELNAGLLEKRRRTRLIGMADPNAVSLPAFMW